LHANLLRHGRAHPLAHSHACAVCRAQNRFHQGKR
jgi:hypothetical protein